MSTDVPIEQIAAWLRVLIEPGCVTELRCVQVVDNPKYAPYTVSGFFDADHLDLMAAACRKWSPKAEGVYWTINPLVPEVLSLANNRVIVRPKTTAADKDVLRRVFIPIDYDPVRISEASGKPAPPSIPSTDAEKARALEKRRLVRERFDSLGFPASILADSGNGYHDLLKVDLPADDGGLVSRFLKALSAEFSDDLVKIDTSLFNPARILKLYGSLSRKGEDLPERPHRYTRILEIPERIEPVPIELLEAVAGPVPADPPKDDGRSPRTRTRTTGRAGAIERGRAYLFSAGFPSSIEGSKGHDRLYHAASVLVDGFGLTREEALPVFREYNEQKAVPPESEFQVHHKIDQAIKNHPVPSLHLLNAQPSRQRNGSAGTYESNGHHAEPDPEPDIDDVEIIDRWPVPDPLVFRGIAGEIVEKVDPHTEADRVATLIQLLTGFANLVGRGPHFVVGATRHYLNLFAVLVGGTSVGRKGTSWDVVRWLLRGVDPDWDAECVKAGLVSGEGLIHHVRDPVVDKDGEITDEGIEEKRLLILETEFSRALKACNKESNTLSDVIRQAWDCGDLRTLAKHKATKATGAHISIVAHTTQADIRKLLTETDTANGFGNRFLWLCVRRSKELPDGGRFFEVDWTPVLRRLTELADAARGVGVMTRDPDASELWRRIYGELSSGRPGLLGAVLSRAEAQVMRLACAYALLDGSAVIEAAHLGSAVLLWKYAEDSARLIFGEALADSDALKLVNALKAAPDGLTRKEITVGVFGCHKKSAVIARLLSDLLTQGLIHRTKDAATGGRPAEKWHAGKGGTAMQSKCKLTPPHAN